MFVNWHFYSPSPLSPQKTTAKKEESPEQALKEFAAIVDQDEPMSDWYTILTHP
jgi:hypothetical protein